MTNYQRRFFALSIFAFSFIFFYEARGRRFVGGGKVEEELLNVAGSTQYWQHVTAGGLVLFLGSMLMVLLHRPNPGNQVARLELVAYALGLGVLIGTAYVSWLWCGG
jgi:hypothetical protein